MAKLNDIMPYLPPSARCAFERLSPFAAERLQEIRLRTNRPLGAVIGGAESFITPRGGVTSSKELALNICGEEIRRSFEAVCEYSVHSYGREIAEGFVTLRGGHRVGLCGTAVYSGDALTGLRNVNGMNFRIAGERHGCADGLCKRLFSDGIHSVLLVGPPMSAKTTMLRDICRILGERHKISLIDSRGELAAVFGGTPCCDVGLKTDILDGYPKATGIQTAVRVMSPEIIVCDEIGDEDEALALLGGLNSGVKFIASAHASDYRELCSRRGIRTLIEAGVFGSAIFLGHGENIGKITQIRKVGEANDDIDGRNASYMRDDTCGVVYVGGVRRESFAALQNTRNAR